MPLGPEEKIIVTDSWLYQRITYLRWALDLKPTPLSGQVTFVHVNFGLVLVGEDPEEPELSSAAFLLDLDSNLSVLEN